MQFKVPQFLDIEDKIFGPFTFREFVYLAGGAGLCYVLFKLLGIWLGIIPIILVAGFSLALTFYKPNGKPFLDMVEASIKYAAQSKLYIWKRHLNNKNNIKIETIKNNLEIPKKNNGLDGNKLRDLAWSLDVLDLKK